MFFRPLACLVVVVMLALAIFPMPLSYYAALRIVVFLVALMELILTSQVKMPALRLSTWMMAFFAMGLAFNPFLVLQTTREMWMVYDVMGMIVFGTAMISHYRAPNVEAPVVAPLPEAPAVKRKGLLYDPEIHKDFEKPGDAGEAPK